MRRRLPLLLGARDGLMRHLGFHPLLPRRISERGSTPPRHPVSRAAGGSRSNPGMRAKGGHNRGAARFLDCRNGGKACLTSPCPRSTPELLPMACCPRPRNDEGRQMEGNPPRGAETNSLPTGYGPSRETAVDSRPRILPPKPSGDCPPARYIFNSPQRNCR